MSNYSNSTLSCLTLNIVSSIFEIIAFSISCILLCFIIYRLLSVNYYQHTLKLNTPVILSINALCLHIAKGVIQFMSINLNTIKRDFYFNIKQNDSFFCRFRSYIFFVVISALYWSYVLQAIFRFTRVLYPRCLWLHRFNTYLYVFIPVQILLAFSSVSPLLFVFDSIRLIPDEVYCTISMEEYIPLIYFFLVIFCLPLNIIFLFYICLICKIRLLLFTRPFRQRNRRDYIVIRRIMLIIIIVSITSLPSIIDLIVYVPNGHLDPFIYRIQWMSSSLNSFIFVISLPFVNPQLCQLIQK